MRQLFRQNLFPYQVLTYRSSDNNAGRALSSEGYNNGTSMTNELCVLYCMGKGYSFAGTEYSSECCG